MTLTQKGSHYIKVPQGCYKFEGDDYVTINAISSQTPDSGSAVSFSCWVKIHNYSAADGGTWTNIVGKHEAHKTWGLSISTPSPQHKFTFHVSGSTEGLNRISYIFDLNKWYHLAGVYNGGDKINADKAMSFYVNSQLIGSQTSPSGISGYHNIPLYIGAGTGSPLSGCIHDVRIWSGCALNANEVERVYNGMDVQTDKLIAHYKFKDRKGTTLEDSQENYNGTITGGEWYERDIRCFNSRWDEGNWDLTIETFIDACDRNYLFDQVTPGAVRELYNILGTPKFIDTTFTSSNSLVFEPISGWGISSLRQRRTIGVKSISDTFLNWETYGIKIEGIRLDI